MKYLFTEKEVKVGDIARVFCNREQMSAFKVLKYFKNLDSIMADVNSLGIKVIKVSKTKCMGYLVHKVKSDSTKVTPYKKDKKLLYLYITSGNVIGLIKYVT